MPRPCSTNSRLQQRSDPTRLIPPHHPATRARGGFVVPDAPTLNDPSTAELAMTRSKRIYVLDTNVLMHDPTALFKFEEHDVYLPMQVIEELDNGKKRSEERRVGKTGVSTCRSRGAPNH